MGRKLSWFREPKLTPLQAFILILGFFYALYIYDVIDWLNLIPDLTKVFTYVVLILLGMFLGGSLVQYKKLAARIRRIARMKGITDATRMDMIMDVLDELLYIVEREIDKKKKGGK